MFDSFRYYEAFNWHNLSSISTELNKIRVNTSKQDIILLITLHTDNQDYLTSNSGVPVLQYQVICIHLTESVSIR